MTNPTRSTRRRIQKRRHQKAHLKKALRRHQPLSLPAAASQHSPPNDQYQSSFKSLLPSISPKLDVVPWLFLPVIFVWFSASYLLGVARQPVWQERDIDHSSQVLAAVSDVTATPSAEVFHWQRTGLVTFWFDDGWLTQYTSAAPALKAADFTAAVAIPTQLIGYDAYMSWGQVKRLYYHFGWEVTAHSRTHNCDQQTFTPDELKNEIIGSFQDLLAQGLRVDNYVVPCGVLTPDLTNLVTQNYASLRTSEGSLNSLPVTNPYHLYAYGIHDNVPLTTIQSWLDEAKSQHQWLILMFHQVDDLGGEYSLRPDTFNQIVTAVKQSGLPVILPSQALQIVIDNP